jgi:hypothetical protein
MPEEFTLQQAQRDRRTVQLHEGPAPAAAVHMDGACNELFASARFALDEDGGVGGRHGSDLLQDSTQGRARPYHAFKPFRAFSWITIRICVWIERKERLGVDRWCLER